MDLSDILSRLESLGREDIDRFMDATDEIRDKLGTLKEKFNEGGVLRAGKAGSKYNITPTLNKIRSRLRRTLIDNEADFIFHMDTMVAKLVSDIKSQFREKLIGADEANIYIENVENWINGTKPFSIDGVRKGFDKLLTKFIDAMNLNEDDFS